jgi:hypothetical protein
VAETESVVLYRVQDRIATVTLNRPEARNALSGALTHALWDAITAAGDAPDVDAVIVTGAGAAFCAGVDLKEISGESPPSAAPRAPGEGPERDSNGLFRFLPVIGKPVIGAINGPAVTGGLEVALQCTFLVRGSPVRCGHAAGRRRGRPEPPLSPCRSPACHARQPAQPVRAGPACRVTAWPRPGSTSCTTAAQTRPAAASAARSPS